MFGLISAIVQLVFAVALLLGFIGALAWGYFSTIHNPATPMEIRGGLLLIGVVLTGLWLGWLWAGPEGK